jgi:hypothetical protein
MSKKPIRLTESDIVKIVAKVMNEQQAVQSAAQPVETSGECVRKGQFVKNCTKLYRKADAGLVVVGPDGDVNISLGQGAYTNLSTADVSYSTREINNRTAEPKAVILGAKGNRADVNTITFLLSMNPQVLLSVLNDADCQKNKTVTFLKTIIRNFGSAQGFLQAVKATPSLMNSENVEEVANTLIKPITGK